MSEASDILAPQFADAAQQEEASILGMWTFLATEVLFFGGLFLAYTLYRFTYPAGFAAGSAHTNLIYGTLNTALLLTSSLTMALSLHAARQDQKRGVARLLALTLFFALSFLFVKALEYHQDFQEHLVPGPGFTKELPSTAQLFFWLYWAMTGLHAIHVLIGIGVLGVMTCLALRGRFGAHYSTPLEVAGLYWHFVDMVWVFLYPLLYLIGRHS